jgi:hypothetical protein
MKYFYAGWGVLLCALSILCSYAVAGTLKTLPWEGDWLLWLINWVGFNAGMVFFLIARSEWRRV